LHHNIFDSVLQGVSITNIQRKVLEHPANVQIVGLIRDGKSILNPDKNIVVQNDDKLILLAKNCEDFESIEKIILKDKENKSVAVG